MKITDDQIRELIGRHSSMYDIRVALGKQRARRGDSRAQARARCAAAHEGLAEPYCACGRRWSQCDGSRLGCRK